MSENLTKAAVRACITLNGVIEALLDGEDIAEHDDIGGVRNELCEAYARLCDALSLEHYVNVHASIQAHICAEINATRAILRAQGVPL